MEDTILSKDIKLREKVTTITKQAVEQVSSLKQVITKKDKDISEISNMAIDVATEYNQLDNKRKAQVRETTKQVEHHKKLAASRLEKMIQSQQEATDLQISIESINEKQDNELAAAKSKIASLTRELHTNKEKVESLECDLTEAIETIDVSTPW
jgi:chromosome segregation ATPase